MQLQSATMLNFTSIQLLGNNKVGEILDKKHTKLFQTSKLANLFSN